MKRLKSSTRQGRTAVRRGRIANKYAPEDDSPSTSVLGKRSHDDNDDNDDSDDSDDDGRIFDSDYNEGDFGEAVQRDHGQEPEGYFSDDDQVFFLFFLSFLSFQFLFLFFLFQFSSSSPSSCPSYPSNSSFLAANSLNNLQAVHELARHFLEAGEDGGLPLGLDLEAIQLEDQYQNTEYGPEPIENAIPTTGFNFDEVDDSDMDMEPPSPPMQTMGPPPRPMQNMELPSRPIQVEDESEFIAHMHFHDPNMSQLEMALGIFADNTGMSRTEWAALRQILTLVDHPMIQRLPNSLTTLKRHLSRELPLLPMRKKSIPLAAEKIATEKALRKSIQTEGDTPMEDLYFFDPTHLYKAFMSSDIAANMHSGMAEYHDFPTELHHSPCWASSIRTTSGCFAHYPNGSPIFPSDFVQYKCLTHGCLVCSGSERHLGRVYSVGRDFCENALERGGVVVEVREVFNVANLRDFLPADLNPKMHSLELIIATEHVSFVPESHIRSGPIHVELDYTSGEKKDKLEDYGQVKLPKVGERFVCRVVDSLESM
jgi:hypothetical protein